MTGERPLATQRPEDYAARRLSFGAEASAYARYRPGYPVEAVRWVLAGADGPATRVVDVGAGTGALTEVLVSAGLDVRAVEPDPGMRAQLQDRVPGATVLAGSAESLPLPDASADAVLVAQAWHWFDHAVAGEQFARVLRPGGVLGLLWNLRDEAVSWMAALSAVVGGEDTLRASREPGNVARAVGPRFGPVERAEFRHSVTHTADSLVGLVETFSYVRLSPHRGQVLAAVRELAASHPDLAGRESFELPYVTAAYRARRPH
jgi:SAM-dependent methyltransferase